MTVGLKIQLSLKSAEPGPALGSLGKERGPLALVWASRCRWRSIPRVIKAPFYHSPICWWVYLTLESLTFHLLEEDKVKTWKFALKNWGKPGFSCWNAVTIYSEVRTTEENRYCVVTEFAPPKVSSCWAFRSVGVASLPDDRVQLLSLDLIGVNIHQPSLRLWYANILILIKTWF